MPDPLALLRALVADENPRVRLQAVVACTYVPRHEAMEVAAIAADFPTDKFLAYALNQAVFALKPYWLPAFKSGKLNLDKKISRLGLLINADGTTDTSLRHDKVMPVNGQTELRIIYDQKNGGLCSGDSGGPSIFAGAAVAGVHSFVSGTQQNPKSCLNEGCAREATCSRHCDR